MKKFILSILAASAVLIAVPSVGSASPNLQPQPQVSQLDSQDIVVALSSSRYINKLVVSSEWYNYEYQVPDTYFYIQDNYAGTLKRVAYQYNGTGRVWGVYSGYIYKSSPIE